MANVSAQRAFTAYTSLERGVFAERSTMLELVAKDATASALRLYALVPDATPDDMRALRIVREAVRRLREVYETPNEPFEDIFQAALAVKLGIGGRYENDLGQNTVYVPYGQRPLGSAQSSPVYEMPAGEADRPTETLIAACRDRFPWLSVQDALVVATTYGSSVRSCSPWTATFGSWDPIVALALAGAHSREGVGSIARIAVAEWQELVGDAGRMNPVRIPGIPRLRGQRLVQIEQAVPSLIDEYVPYDDWFHQSSEFLEDPPAVTGNVLFPGADDVAAWFGRFRSTELDDAQAPALPAVYGPSSEDVYLRLARRSAASAHEPEEPQPGAGLAEQLEALTRLHAMLVRQRRSHTPTLNQLHDAAVLAGRRAANRMPVDLKILAMPYLSEGPTSQAAEFGRVVDAVAEAWDARSRGDYLPWLKLGW